MKMEKLPIDPQTVRGAGEAPRRAGLIIGELVQAQRPAAKPEQVRALVEEQAQSYEQPTEVVKWFYIAAAALAEIEGVALEDNVVNWVLPAGQGGGQGDYVRRTDGERSMMRNWMDPYAGGMMDRHARSRRALGLDPDGDRAERPRRARLRHLFAPAEGAGGVPGRPGQRGDGQPDRRAVAVPRVRESGQGHLLLHQLAGRLGVGRAGDLRHHAVHQARRVARCASARRPAWARCCWPPAPRASASACPIRA